jgi:hypothetical protein
VIKGTRVTIGPDPSQVAGNCYGIAVYGDSLGGTAFPLIAQVEGVDGTSESMLIQPGVYYLFDVQASTVTVATANGSTGTVIVDAGRLPGDFVNAVSLASKSSRTLDEFTLLPATYPANSLLRAFTRPAGADSFALIMASGTGPDATWRVTYGGTSWEFNSSSPSFGFPAVMMLMGPRTPANVALNGSLGLTYVGAGLAGLPAPDAIQFRASAIGGGYTVAAPTPFVAIWWSEGNP